MAAPEAFPDYQDDADFSLFEDSELIFTNCNNEMASSGETRHLRNSLRQLTVSWARELRFSQALAEAEASDKASKEDIEDLRRQALWATRDHERQKELIRNDELVQRYEASNPADPIEVRAAAISRRINFKHTRGEGRHGDSWHNLFGRERKRLIDCWEPTLIPPETKKEANRRQELDDQYKHSDWALQPFHLEKQNARRRERQDYPPSIVEAAVRRSERGAREPSPHSVRDTDAAKTA